MFRFLKKETDRREFFKDSGRVILGSGLLALSVLLGSRKEDPNAVEPCQLSLPCSGCRRLSDCKKEQAAAFRQKQELSLQNGQLKEGVSRSGR